MLSMLDKLIVALPIVIIFLWVVITEPRPAWYWPAIVILIIAEGYFLYLSRKRKFEQDAFYLSHNFNPDYDWGSHDNSIAIDLRTNRIALRDRGVHKIFTSDQITNCKSGKQTETRTDSNGNKTKHTSSWLDISTSDMDTPNFRIQFEGSPKLEEWRARINNI